jgi:hypothetical protein
MSMLRLAVVVANPVGSDAITGIGVAMLIGLAVLLAVLWVVLAGRAARRPAPEFPEPKTPRRLSLVRRVRRPDGEADVLKLEKEPEQAAR